MTNQLVKKGTEKEGFLLECDTHYLYKSVTAYDNYSDNVQYLVENIHGDELGTFSSFQAAKDKYLEVEREIAEDGPPNDDWMSGLY